jgi:hypothetical protein
MSETGNVGEERPVAGPRRCPQCEGADFEEGFVEDMGQSSQGYARWIAGPLERGIFGGAYRLGKERYPVAAYRCRRCSHLVLFVTERG